MAGGLYLVNNITRGYDIYIPGLQEGGGGRGGRDKGQH